MLHQHHLAELTLAHLLPNRKVRFFELFGSGRLFDFHLNFEGFLHSSNRKETLDWFGHLDLMGYLFGCNDWLSLEGLSMRRSFGRKHEGLRRKVIGLDWLVTEIWIFLLEHSSFSLHRIISRHNRRLLLLRLSLHVELTNSVQRVSSICGIGSFCVIREERFIAACICDGFRTRRMDCYFGLFLLKEGNRTGIHCRFSTGQLKVRLGFAFRLLANSILHPFIEKLQLLLDCRDFPLPLVLHRFIRELFLRGLDWLLLGQQGIKFAGAKWWRVGLGDIEAWETVDVFAVIILENEGGREFSLFVVWFKGEIAGLG